MLRQARLILFMKFLKKNFPLVVEFSIKFLEWCLLNSLNREWPHVFRIWYVVHSTQGWKKLNPFKWTLICRPWRGRNNMTYMYIYVYVVDFPSSRPFQAVSLFSAWSCALNYKLVVLLLIPKWWPPCLVYSYDTYFSLS